MTPALALAGFILAATAFAGPDSEQNQFLQQCRASFDEPWRSVPWKISLLEGQKLAAETRKPIFIWAMDGHPLGCT